MTETIEDAYESVMQFLYLAPIGLAQVTGSGAIEMINPMSAQLLLPLSHDGELDNLFTALSDVVPDLSDLVVAFEPQAGVVCDAVRFRVEPAPGRLDSSKVLSLSLIKMSPQRLMAVINDVTVEADRERQGLIRQLQDSARSDLLTGLPNRLAVHEHLQRLLAQPKAANGLAVAFLNCDRFKHINDAFGHVAGDATLCLMADRLRLLPTRSESSMPGSGTGWMVARIGGDEFLAVFEQMARPDEIHAIARRLIDGLHPPYCVDDRQIRCSVSIGIVLGAHAGDDADRVLQDASIAMREAKRLGGGRHVVYEPGMRIHAERRGKAEADIRRALSADEFFVEYQPVVLLRSDGSFDRTAGVEALVRWRHPDRGLVSPADFIGLAEECGLITRIGQFVLETAVRDFVGWQRSVGALSPGLMAVNLSRAQLAEEGFVTLVRDILTRCGMSAAQLQLEVTESLAAQDERVQARLCELKALGVSLALDDFGTGYSSLSSLHQLPVDTVKIDRSFVSRVADSHHHRVLIEATVRVATSLGMRTVAEGIETDDQAKIVQALGCDKGQGFLISRPLGEAALRDWLRAGDAAQVGGACTTLRPPTASVAVRARRWRGECYAEQQTEMRCIEARDEAIHTIV